MTVRRVFWSVLLLAGCTHQPPTSPPASVATSAAGHALESPASREYRPGISARDTAPHEFILAGAPRGEQLYATFCASCHGTDGRGGGQASPFTRVPPADFTRAEFKVRSTALGALPTDRDLEDVIRNGAGGDGAMPPFQFLATDDVRALVNKVKSFSPRWTHERAPAPVPLPVRQSGDARRGAEIYGVWGCPDCHGPNGVGDGPMARSLRHARGFAETPADLTRPWMFRRGGAESELLRSVVTGFTGTSMAAYTPPVRSGSDLWDLVAHLRSLQRPPPDRARASPDSMSATAYWRPPLRAGHGSIASPTCATCHPLQFADWSRSRHAMAMGPGVWAQMQERDSGGNCASCHAPLAEQAEEAYLQADSVSCAACHVRAGETFGPAPTPATLLPLVSGSRSGHGKVQTRAFFEQSEFCAGCHHFSAGTAPTVAGTTLQNTLEEWRNSRAAREGRTCQTCHMPDRRHFFRGIHDPDTVRRAVRSTFEANPSATGVTARMTLTNVGAGHFLPTYVVPEIWMRIDLKDEAGATLAFAEQRIARKVKFENGDWTQTSDTRLAPDQTATLDYTGAVPPATVLIVGRVIVLPDLWQADKFRARLAETRSDPVSKYYSAALQDAETSGYTLFRAERRLAR